MSSRRCGNLDDNIFEKMRMLRGLKCSSGKNLYSLVNDESRCTMRFSRECSFVYS